MKKKWKADKLPSNSYFNRLLRINRFGMKSVGLESRIEFLHISELNQDELLLLEKAQEISKSAYAPYSGFFVGAAMRLFSGEILQSNNQENVSFPVGVCAEHSLLAYSGANFPADKPIQMAIVAKRKGEEIWASVAPCGVCRQALQEAETRFKGPISLLILQPEDQVIRVAGIKNLLPFSFDDLKK